MLYKRSKEVQGIILFNTTYPGEYSLAFANYESQNDIVLTIALHTYEVKEEPIEYEIVNNERFIRG